MLLCFRLFCFFHCLFIAIAQLRRAGTASLYFYTVRALIPALYHVISASHDVTVCHCGTRCAGLELLVTHPVFRAGFPGQHPGTSPAETSGIASDSPPPRVLGAFE